MQIGANFFFAARIFENGHDLSNYSGIVLKALLGMNKSFEFFT